jgi:hypothetical protein
MATGVGQPWASTLHLERAHIEHIPTTFALPATERRFPWSVGSDRPTPDRVLDRECLVQQWLALPLGEQHLELVRFIDQVEHRFVGGGARQGGNTVYVRPSSLGYYETGWVMAMVLHELLHNVTGLTDPDLQRNLGLSESGGSVNITLRLAADCLT